MGEGLFHLRYTDDVTLVSGEADYGTPSNPRRKGISGSDRVFLGSRRWGADGRVDGPNPLGQKIHSVRRQYC